MSDIDAGTVRGRAILDTRQWTSGVTRVVNSVDTLLSAIHKLNTAQGGMASATASLGGGMRGGATQVVPMSSMQQAQRTVRAIRQDTDAIRDTFRGGAAALWGASPALGALAGTMGSIHTSALRAGAAFVGIAGIIKGIQFNAFMEQANISMGVLLNNTRAANVLLQQLQVTARDTPLEFAGLRDSARNLLAYGFGFSQISDTLTMLGDVAYGVQQPLEDIVYLYGTIRTQGRAMTIDLNQFANRGIPIYEYLSQVTGQSVTKIRQLASEGKIGFKEIEAAFKRMTAEGGSFYKMLESNKDSLTGSWAALKDNVSIALGAFTGPLSTSIAELLRNINSAIVDMMPQIKNLGEAFNSAASIVVGGPLSLLLELLEGMLGILDLLPDSVTAAAISFGSLFAIVSRINPVLGLIVGTIGGMITLVSTLIQQNDLLSKQNQARHRETIGLLDSLSLLNDQDKVTETQLESLARLYPELNNKIKPYVSTVKELSDATKELAKAGINSQLADAIKERDTIAKAITQDRNNLVAMIAAQQKFIDAAKAQVPISEKFRFTGIDTSTVEGMRQFLTLAQSMGGQVKQIANSIAPALSSLELMVSKNQKDGLDYEFQRISARIQALFKMLGDLDSRFIPPGTEPPPTFTDTPKGRDWGAYTQLPLPEAPPVIPPTQFLITTAFVDDLKRFDINKAEYIKDFLQDTSKWDSWVQFSTDTDLATQAQEQFYETLKANMPDMYESMMATWNYGDGVEQAYRNTEDWAKALKLLNSAILSINLQRLEAAGKMMENIGNSSEGFTYGLKAAMQAIAELGSHIQDLAKSMDVLQKKLAENPDLPLADKLAAALPVLGDTIATFFSFVKGIGAIVSQSIQEQLDNLSMTNEAAMQGLSESLILSNNTLTAQYNADIQAQKDAYDQGLINEETYRSNVQDISDSYEKQKSANEYKNELDRYNQQVAFKAEYDKLAKQKFEADKAFAIGQVWISTGMGIASAWATSMSLGPIAGPIVAGILTAALIGMAIAQTSNIQKQQYNSPVASPSTPTLPAINPSIGNTSSSGGQGATTINVSFEGAYLRDEQMMRETVAQVIQELGRQAKL